MDETKFNKAVRSSINFIAVVALLGFFWGLWWENFSLSKAGDFMSGAVAPVAVFWLMQVYKLQMKEMGKILSEQKETNSINKRQNDIAELNYKPMFTARICGQFVTKD